MILEDVVRISSLRKVPSLIRLKISDLAMNIVNCTFNTLLTVECPVRVLSQEVKTKRIFGDI